LDLSKLRLGIYDFLSIALPGLLAVAGGWILLRGWSAFVCSMSQISGTGLTLLLVFAFGVGHIVQELGDFAIRLLKGRRYLYSARDSFWGSDEAKIVRQAIRKELGHEIGSVDAAFDYCLTKSQGQFEKRDVFVATSDLSRSLVVLSFLLIAPAIRISFRDVSPCRQSIEVLASSVVVLAVIATLAWRRMMRFRELSEVTVFRTYLAVAKQTAAT
jgi:hypothetical protein